MYTLHATLCMKPRLDVLKMAPFVVVVIGSASMGYDALSEASLPRSTIRLNGRYDLIA